MVSALLIGTMTAIAAAVLGNFVVAARQSVVSDVLAHTALAGVGLGLLWGAPPLVGAFATVLLTAGILWIVMRANMRSADAISMLLLTGGLAVALVAAHAAKNTALSFEMYLFGSILTMARADIVTYGIVTALIVVGCVTLWPHMVTVVFDPLYARTRVRYAAAVEMLFFVMIALLTAVGLRVIGGLLVGALLIIPAITAHHCANSFRVNTLLSVCYGMCGIWVGIIASFVWDIPASGGIVLTLVALYVITALITTLWRRERAAKNARAT